MRIRDHQLDAAQAAPCQAVQEPQPERLRFQRADVQADDLAPAVGVDRHSDYRRDGDDAPALPLLQIRCIEPQIRPVASERPVEESLHALVDVLAQLADLALADPTQPHCLHQVLDPARRHATDPGFLDHRDQCLLGHFAGLEERREITALPQLRNAQLQPAEPGIEHAVAEAIAPGCALAAAFIASGADQAVHIHLHQQLQHRLRHAAQKITITGLLQKLGQRQSLLGHRVLSRLEVKLHISTIADRSDGRLPATPSAPAEFPPSSGTLTGASIVA